MKGRLLLDVVVAEGAAVLKLLARENQALLVRGDSSRPTMSGHVQCADEKMYAPLLVLDLSLDIVDSVRRLDLKGDSLAREGLYENLHFCKRIR